MPIFYANIRDNFVVDRVFCLAQFSNVNVNALFMVEVHLAIKLVYRHSSVNNVKATAQT